MGGNPYLTIFHYIFPTSVVPSSSDHKLLVDDKNIPLSTTKLRSYENKHNNKNKKGIIQNVTSSFTILETSIQQVKRMGVQNKLI